MTANSRLKTSVDHSQEVLIFVKGLEFYAFHGVSDEEQTIGHRYEVDLEMTVRTEATATDSVTDSVDYGDVATEIARFSQEARFRTVERLGQGIVDVLFSRYPRVKAIRLRVAKRLPPAPIIAVAAGIELFQTRPTCGIS